MRSLPDPGFAGDPGTAQPAVRDALVRYAADGRANPVLVVLSSTAPIARLLVPVLASPPVEQPLREGASEDPVAAPREGDVSTVLMQGADGRRALLAFTSLTSLRAWNAAARPVPVTARAAAEAARAEGAAALLLDVAGPIGYVVETAELAELAAGHALVETSAGFAWFASWPSHAP